MTKTTYGRPGGVGNYSYIPMERLECGGNLVPWLFVEPWIFWYPRTGLGAVGNTTHGWPRGVGNSFYIHTGRLECGGNLLPWFCIEPWILRHQRTGTGSIHSTGNQILHEMMFYYGQDNIW